MRLPWRKPVTLTVTAQVAAKPKPPYCLVEPCGDGSWQVRLIVGDFPNRKPQGAADEQTARVVAKSMLDEHAKRKANYARPSFTVTADASGDA